MEKDDGVGGGGVDVGCIRQEGNIYTTMMVELLVMMMNLTAPKYCCCGGVGIKAMSDVAIKVMVDNRCCSLAMVVILRRISMTMVMLMAIDCENGVVVVVAEYCSLCLVVKAMVLLMMATML